MASRTKKQSGAIPAEFLICLNRLDQLTASLSAALQLTADSAADFYQDTMSGSLGALKSVRVALLLTQLRDCSKQNKEFCTLATKTISISSNSDWFRDTSRRRKRRSKKTRKGQNAPLQTQIPAS